MKHKCKRCGHEWIKRKLDGDPKMCPKCKSYKYKEEKTDKPKAKGKETKKKIKKNEINKSESKGFSRLDFA